MMMIMMIIFNDATGMCHLKMTHTTTQDSQATVPLPKLDAFSDFCVLLGYYAASYGNFLPTFRDNVIGPIFKGQESSSVISLKSADLMNIAAEA